MIVLLSYLFAMLTRLRRCMMLLYGVLKCVSCCLFVGDDLWCKFECKNALEKIGLKIEIIKKEKRFVKS